MPRPAGDVYARIDFERHWRTKHTPEPVIEVAEREVPVDAEQVAP